MRENKYWQTGQKCPVLILLFVSDQVCDWTVASKKDHPREFIKLEKQNICKPTARQQ